MRKEVKAQTLAQRKRYDRLLRESQNTAIPPYLSLTKVSHFCWLPTVNYANLGFARDAVEEHRRPNHQADCNQKDGRYVPRPKKSANGRDCVNVC